LPFASIGFSRQVMVSLLKFMCFIYSDTVQIDKYAIVPDPMDNKIEACANCLAIFSFIVTLINIFIADLGPADDVIHVITLCFLSCVAGCEASQIRYELYKGGPPGSGVKAGEGAPEAEEDMNQ
jgi:hypothetical protein